MTETNVKDVLKIQTRFVGHIYFHKTKKKKQNKTTKKNAVSFEP